MKKKYIIFVLISLLSSPFAHASEEANYDKGVDELVHTMPYIVTDDQIAQGLEKRACELAASTLFHALMSFGAKANATSPKEILPDLMNLDKKAYYNSLQYQNITKTLSFVNKETDIRWKSVRYQAELSGANVKTVFCTVFYDASVDID